MSTTIAVAIGRGTDSESRETRTGDRQSEGQANTERTFATAKTNADGSGEVKVERIIDGGKFVLGFLKFGPEDREDAREVDFNVNEGRWIPRGAFSQGPPPNSICEMASRFTDAVRPTVSTVRSVLQFIKALGALFPSRNWYKPTSATLSRSWESDPVISLPSKMPLTLAQRRYDERVRIQRQSQSERSLETLGEIKD